MRKFAWQHLPLILVFLLVVVGSLTEYFYKNDVVYENPNLVAESQVSVYTEKIGRLVFLPKDEIPSVATVSEPELLNNQVFFAEAQKGYVVLIYSNARKAILYDPILDKIIAMASVNIGEVEQSTEMLPDLQPGQFKESGETTENQF